MALLALTLALVAVPAPAAVPLKDSEPGIVPAFTFPASHGYSAIGLAAPAHSGDPAQLLLIFARKHASATYLAPAEVDEAGRVRADLGPLGEVDLEFVANGKVAHARSACGGEGFSYSAGEYRGTIDFKGEEGYTRVEADHASLLPRLLVNVVCSGGGYGWTAPGPGGQLVAKSGTGSTAFKAIKKTPAARSYFSARINEKRGRLRIFRYLSAGGPASDFAFPRRGQRAHVSPPAPFSGSAGLRGGRWQGSLSVDFPGHSDVSLAGPGIRAHLLHARFSGSVARGLE